MNNKFIELLRCPVSGQMLRLKDKISEITGESLRVLISEDGKNEYPVKNNIPRFVPKDNYSDSFGMQWNIFSKTQLDGYSGIRASNDRFWSATNWTKEKLSGQWVLDIGCGAGYFVAACILKNISATGYDVSKSMTSYGNEQLKFLTNHNNFLKNLSEDGIFGKIGETEATVITAIGVIEHLRSPQLLFDAFKKSRAQYLYYSVPMFSISAILENTFPHVFPRQLSGGHTHLFTESSISYMHKLLNSKSIAEWRFGTDMMDLYRSIIVMLQNNGASSKMVKLTSKKIFPNIDAWQGIVDKSHFCSEIHCLIKKCDL